MGTDFFFKLFAREYLTSREVRSLSLEQQGVLLRLWCVCCLEGSLPNDLEEIAAATGLKYSQFHLLEAPLMQFFKLGEDKRWHSRRMEAEQHRNHRVREARSRAGKESGRVRSAQIEQIHELGTYVQTKQPTNTGTKQPTNGATDNEQHRANGLPVGRKSLNGSIFK